MIEFLVQPLVENVKEFTERKICFNSDGKLFYVAKGNGNVVRVHDRSSRKFKVFSWLDWSNVKEIDNSQIHLNKIFWSVDLFGTLLLRWI